MEIVIYPDERLLKKAEKVEDVGQEIYEIGKNMLNLMEKKKGVGLAGNQVGILKRIIVVNVEPVGKKIIANPEIVEKEGELFEEEGCLSLPGLYRRIKRFSYVKVRGVDVEKGEEIEFEVEGLPARVFQHEIDHLNGVLFIDHLSPIQKRLALEKYRKLQKRRK